MLYDSGNYKLERARKLNFEEIWKQAQEYFDEKFETANDFCEVQCMTGKMKNIKCALFIYIKLVRTISMHYV